MRSRALAVALLAAAGAVFVAPAGVGPGILPAQSVAERTPNVDDPWRAAAGRLHFHFLHRFAVTDPPVRKVLNSPTFLLAAGLPWDLAVGARYATNSLLVPATPNELEFFTRWVPLAESAGNPLGLGVQVAYNRAAESVDGELALKRSLGPLTLLVVGRAFSAFQGGSGEAAVAVGGVWRFSRHLALAADIGAPLGVDETDPVWGAGLQMEIPYTPHSFSVHLSNANTTTLQGASAGAGHRRWGFEFTVPVTLSRYLGAGEAGSGAGPPDEAARPAAVVVEMDNRLRFLPDTVRIAVGERVEWRNSSDLIHTVTADPGRVPDPRAVRLPQGASPFDSGDLVPGARFAHTFTVAGVYRYVCVPHAPAGMTGVVIVEGG